MNGEDTMSATASPAVAVGKDAGRDPSSGNKVSGKTVRVFSGPLFRQTVRSNLALALVILLIMILMSTVINFAMSVMSDEGSDDITSEEAADAQQDFYAYLSAMAAYDQSTQADLSWDDFSNTSDKTAYEQMFDMMNQQSPDMDLSVAGLEDAAARLERTDVPIDTYVRQFEYAYALAQTQGVFSGDELDAEDMLDTMFAVSGVSNDLMDTMESMDSTSLLNQMYYTVMGLLPILLFIVIVANGLIAGKVDQGSMAYVLSTPTKRSAVVFTQALYLLIAPLIMIAIVCCTRVATSFMFFDDVSVERIVVLYVGMYVLVEAIAGICYLGSCLFNRSSGSMAFGGGLTVWFFLASLMGLFGAQSMVDVGMGIEQLGVFNDLTLVGLFDIDSISSIGTDNVDYAFVWKLVVLAAVALVCYVAGAIRFQRKDLPL